MKQLAFGLLVMSTLSAAPAAQQTFTGVIADSECAAAGHARMRMGPTDADCTIACVIAHDAAYVLVDGPNAYRLSDQQTPEKFAGQAVRVVGTLDAGTKIIRVESIAPAT